MATAPHVPTTNEKTFTKDEIVLLNAAIQGAIDSAKRQQNMKGKTPIMVEVYKQHENTLIDLQRKITSSDK